MVSHPDSSLGTGGHYLFGMSCTGPTDCWAVGEAGSVNSLAEHFDGSAWSIVSTPSPSGSVINLYWVSCVTSSFCEAVGADYPPGSGTVPIIETWDGADWSIG